MLYAITIVFGLIVGFLDSFLRTTNNFKYNFRFTITEREVKNGY